MRQLVEGKVNLNRLNCRLVIFFSAQQTRRNCSNVSDRGQSTRLMTSLVAVHVEDIGEIHQAVQQSFVQESLIEHRIKPNNGRKSTAFQN